jgi:adenine phosphoribosyltransferase
MTRDANEPLRSRLRGMIRSVDGHADVWSVFEDGKTFEAVVDALIEKVREWNPTRIAGIEARGFLLGGAVAKGLRTGFAAVRKEGGLYPGDKLSTKAHPDYQGKEETLRLRRDAIARGDRVALVDDWCETGSQVVVARALIESCGGRLVGVAVLVDQLPKGIAATLPAYEWLVKADDLDL